MVGFNDKFYLTLSNNIVETDETQTHFPIASHHTFNTRYMSYFLHIQWVVHQLCGGAVV